MFRRLHAPASLVVGLALALAGSSVSAQDDLQCSDFASQADAQIFAFIDGPTATPKLDLDGDGWVCEWNPAPFALGFGGLADEPVVDDAVATAGDVDAEASIDGDAEVESDTDAGTDVDVDSNTNTDIEAEVGTDGDIVVGENEGEEVEDDSTAAREDDTSNSAADTATDVDDDAGLAAETDVALDSDSTSDVTDTSGHDITTIDVEGNVVPGDENAGVDTEMTGQVDVDVVADTSNEGVSRVDESDTGIEVKDNASNVTTITSLPNAGTGGHRTATSSADAMPSSLLLVIGLMVVGALSSCGIVVTHRRQP